MESIINQELYENVFSIIPGEQHYVAASFTETDCYEVFAKTKTTFIPDTLSAKKCIYADITLFHLIFY